MIIVSSLVPPIPPPAAPVTVAALAFATAAAALAANGTRQLTATPTDAQGAALAGRTVTYASSAPGVATVSSAGLVSALAAGSATITATCEGQRATCTVTVSAAPVATPTPTPTPAPSTAVLSATLRRLDSGTGAGSWGVPIPPRWSGVTDADLLTLRLYDAFTNAEIPTTAPIRLAGDVRALRVGTDTPGAMPRAVVYRCSATGLARLAPIPSAPVPTLAAWPDDPADYCATKLWPLPLVPVAQRVASALPAGLVQLDDKYLDESRADTAMVEAQITLEAPATDTLITDLRQGGATAYDRYGTMLAEGCRRGGADAASLFYTAMKSMDRWDTFYTDPILSNYDEPHPRPTSRPAWYWLTGHEFWRQRAVMAGQGGTWRGRQDVWAWFTPQVPGSPPAIRNDGDTRRLANTVLALSAAMRVDADLTNYPDAEPKIQEHMLDVFSRNTLEEVLGILCAQQYDASTPYNGSWGGDRTHGDDRFGIAPSPDAGAPGWKPFDIGMLHSALIIAAESGHVSAARKAALQDAVLRGNNYVFAKAYQPGGWFPYTWPVPTSWTGLNGHDDTGDYGNLSDAMLNPFHGIVCAYLWKVTGEPVHKDRCAALYASATQERYSSADTGYFNGATPQARKAFDQMHWMRGSAMAFLTA